MPVYRFKTFEEARRAQWREPGDPEIVEILRVLWAFSDSLAGDFTPPRGVFKFRTIEEANQHRQAWEQERVERLRQQRARS